MDLPNIGEIQTLPATSSWLVYSRDFKYSLSARSSSALAQGNAILNMPVALTNPSLLLRCLPRHRSAIVCLSHCLIIKRSLPSKNRFLGAVAQYAMGRSPIPSDPWGGERADGRIRTGPGFQASLHLRCRSGRGEQKGLSFPDDGAATARHLQSPAMVSDMGVGDG